MNARISRWAATGCAIAGISAAGLFASPAMASAAPAAPTPSTNVPGTSCTLSQVENTIAKDIPKLAARINAHPKAKAAFEKWVTMPQDKRDARAKAFAAKHPDRVAKWQKHHDKITAEVNKVKTTCAS